MKRIPKKERKIIVNELIKFLKDKQDIEKRKIAHAYFEKKEYEMTKKVH